MGRPPLSLQDYERLLPPQSQVFGGPDFFPADAGMRLVTLSDSSAERKLVYRWTWPLAEESGLPEPIIEAIRFGECLHQPANRAILKRYGIDDIMPSGAYDLHQDPEIFATQRIALISLSGLARLQVITRSGAERYFDCAPNTVLFLAPDLLHSITPPLNPDGVRHFLFLGYDHSLETVS